MIPEIIHNQYQHPPHALIIFPNQVQDYKVQHIVRKIQLIRKLLKKLKTSTCIQSIIDWCHLCVGTTK